MLVEKLFAKYEELVDKSESFFTPKDKKDRDKLKK